MDRTSVDHGLKLRCQGAAEEDVVVDEAVASEEDSEGVEEEDSHVVVEDLDLEALVTAPTAVTHHLVAAIQGEVVVATAVAEAAAMVAEEEAVMEVEVAAATTRTPLSTVLNIYKVRLMRRSVNAWRCLKLQITFYFVRLCDFYFLKI